MSQIRKSSAVGPNGAVYDLGQYRARLSGSSAAQTVEASDQAAVSEGARELMRARAAVQTAPELRANLIKQLKLSIAEGSYNPDPREIARHSLERGL